MLLNFIVEMLSDLKLGPIVADWIEDHCNLNKKGLPNFCRDLRNPEYIHTMDLLQCVQQLGTRSERKLAVKIREAMISWYAPRFHRQEILKEFNRPWLWIYHKTEMIQLIKETIAHEQKQTSSNNS